MRNVLIRTASFSLGIFIYQLILRESGLVESLERAIFVGIVTSLLVAGITRTINKLQQENGMKIFMIVLSAIAVMTTLMGEPRVSKYALLAWQISSFLWAMLCLSNGQFILFNIENVNTTISKEEIEE